MLLGLKNPILSGWKGPHCIRMKWPPFFQHERTPFYHGERDPIIAGWKGPHCIWVKPFYQDERDPLYQGEREITVLWWNHVIRMKGTYCIKVNGILYQDERNTLYHNERFPIRERDLIVSEWKSLYSMKMKGRNIIVSEWKVPYSIKVKGTSLYQIESVHILSRWKGPTVLGWKWHTVLGWKVPYNQDERNLFHQSQRDPIISWWNGPYCLRAKRIPLYQDKRTPL